MLNSAFLPSCCFIWFLTELYIYYVSTCIVYSAHNLLFVMINFNSEKLIPLCYSPLSWPVKKFKKLSAANYFFFIYRISRSNVIYYTSKLNIIYYMFSFSLIYHAYRLIYFLSFLQCSCQPLVWNRLQALSKQALWKLDWIILSWVALILAALKVTKRTLSK
jgi:hypothetical protein